MKNRTRISSFIILAGLVCSAILLSSNKAQEPQDGNRAQRVMPNVFPPEIPTSMVFAGDTIDLTQQDRRERMDKEMLSFTYSHINTMLIIKRANRLFPVVEPILNECGVPDDFKYLMIIESNGDPEAFSPSKAGGLWQFLEKTGREYGLEVTDEIDERYHTEKATRAACKYLKDSYELYGDWLTVAASYNTGRTNVAKRKERQKEERAINLVLPDDLVVGHAEFLCSGTDTVDVSVGVAFVFVTDEDGAVLKFLTGLGLRLDSNTDNRLRELH